MTDQTNPRKLYRSGTGAVISLPKEWREEHGFSIGDRFVLERSETGFVATKVEWRQSTDG